MDCISCHNPMIVLEIDQVEVDFCLVCGGIWLDSGELEILMKEPEKISRILPEATPADKLAPSRFKCPICRKKMQELTLGRDLKLNIDHCLSGHGLWFDKGELEQVAGLFQEGEGLKVAKLLKDIFRK